MNNTPLVYIILVNYKSVEHTIECIKSLRQITYSNYKIIVVDNDSKDHSVERLKEYEKGFVLIESKSNTGFAGGNNLGIDYATQNNADYVLLLNNDTTVEPNFLDELIKRTDPKIGINIGKILFYYDRSMLWYAGGKINKLKGSTDVNGFEKDNGKYDKEEYVTFASGCCMLISQEILNKVGMLREDYFLYFEDTDYCAKVLANGYEILYCPKSIIYHKESISTVKESFDFLYYITRNRLYFIKDNIGGINKLISYLYSTIFILIKAIIKNQDKLPIIRAYKDFFRNIRRKIIN
jgi:GT2 family glycosyltransferase